MKLQRQLLLTTSLLSLGPLLALGIAAYLYVSAQFVEAAMREVRNVATLEATQAQHSVEHKRRLLEGLTESGGELWTRIAEAEHCEIGDYAAGDEHLQTYLEQQWPHEPSLLGLAVLSSAQEVLASTGDGGESWIRERCDPDTNLGAALEYGESDPRLVLAVPLVEPAGTRRGVLCARFSFDVHRFLVDTTEKQAQRTTSYLVAADGRVLCSSIPHNEGAGLDSPHEHHRNLPAMGKNPWQDRYKLDHGGGEVLASYAPAGELGWGVLVEVPVEHALASIEVLKWQGLLSAPLLLLALVGMVSMLSGRLAQPLARLVEAVRRTGEGASGAAVVADGPAEVAELAEAFNEMSAAVQGAREGLEERIAERTRALRDSRGFLELILNSIEQRVLVVDAAMQITRANRMALEMHGEALVGRPYADEIESQGDGLIAIRNTFRTGEAQSSECQQWVRGQQEIVQTDTFPVRAPGGGIEAVVEVARVVTRERALRSQLAHQEKMATIGMLSAGIAHDIGNPLASILSQLRIARDGGPDAVRETLAVVEAEMQRMARLLRELTDFTRRKRRGLVRLDLRSVIDSASRLLQHDPRARGVDIHTEVSGELPAVRASEDDLIQVLLNLGINALDAMPDGGKLRFSCRRSGDQVQVLVQDSGCGVPVAIRAQIFEPLVSSKPEGRGTGLGLFVSRRIVEGCGGTLDLEQTGDAGTTFALHLPVAEPGPSA